MKGETSLANDHAAVATAPGGLAGLEALIKAQGQSQADAGHPPVHHWNPPYCGEIGMRIAADGTWFYQGSPIGRKPLVKLFASVLRKDADGRHYLVTPVEKVGIDVDDAPFMAVEMDVTGSGSTQVLRFRSNVDDWVDCGPAHPMRFGTDPRSGGRKPYVNMRAGLEALLTRALYYDLVALASNHAVAGTNQFGIWSGGQFFAMADAALIDSLT